MLISFTVENLSSFKDKMTLDMRASRSIKAHVNSVIDAGKHKLLPVTAIYGANASGKTNLIRALTAAIECIAGREGMEAVPFLFGDLMGKALPSYNLKFAVNVGGKLVDIELDFQIMGGDFYYERLRYCDNGTNRFSNIYTKEWDEEKKAWVLKIGDCKFAPRMRQVIKYFNEFETGQNRLFLAVLGKWAAASKQHGQYPLLENIYLWAQKALLYEEPHPKKMARPIFSKGSAYPLFVEEEKNRSDLNAFLHDVNPMIKRFSFTEMQKQGFDAEDYEKLIASQDPANREFLVPVFNYGIDGALPDMDETLTGFESKGVWTAMFIYPPIHDTLHNGGIFIVDELENSLHPLLMAKIISLFTNPETNPGGGQFIFTTHNALLMRKKHFRQDEIVFVEKDEAGASSLYRLSDIEGVRSDLDFCKNYILGAFGAVPQFSDVDDEA